jgi:iron complex outermembrane recepter protein
MNTRKMLLAATAVALAMSAEAAWAQDAAQEPADRNAEIIVTARKQAESILNVPVVESVLTEAAIERYQINDIQDVVAKIPGLFSGNAVLAIGEQMSLRGVGSNSLDQGVDQSVSLNIDGLSVTHGLAYRAATFDLQQVEVFKGPQALYYGKNSTAGVISLRSADPGDTLEVKGKLGYEFEAAEKRGELVISGPVTETLGLRLAGLYSDSRGSLYNTATALAGRGGKDPKYYRFGGGTSYLIRATLLWKPLDNFSARLKANFAKDDMHQGGGTQLTSCPDGLATPVGMPAGVQFQHPTETCQFDETLNIVDLDPALWPGIRNNGVPFLKLKQNFGTLELNYDLNPELSLTSTTGYYKSHVDTMINGISAGYTGPPIAADNIFERREITQELRLASDFNSPLNFTAGLYYQDGKMFNNFTLHSNGALNPGTLTATPPGVLIRGTSTVEIESISAFGQLRFEVSDQLELAGGVRWQHEKRGLGVFMVRNAITNVTNRQIALKPGSDKISSKNWSPEFTITYKPTDSFTIFGALKQAYKSGSFIIVIPGNDGEDKSFGDEKVQGGEVGIKSRWLDRSLSFDIAGYYYRYKGLQTGVNETNANGLPNLRTINAGKAEVYGIDMEMRYRPPSIDGLDLHLAVNWNKTKFLELNNVPCRGGQGEAEGCNQFFTPNNILPASQQAIYPLGRFNAQNLQGVSFTRAPEWQLNFGLAYDMPVGENMKLSFGVDNQAATDYLAILGSRPDFRRPGYLKTDVSLTLYGPDEKWSIGVVGNNLQDKHVAGFCSNSSFLTGQSIIVPKFGAPVADPIQRNAAGVDEMTCSSVPGRSIWIRVGFKI